MWSSSSSSSHSLAPISPCMHTDSPILGAEAWELKGVSAGVLRKEICPGLSLDLIPPRLPCLFSRNASIFSILLPLCTRFVSPRGRVYLSRAPPYEQLDTCYVLSHVSPPSSDECWLLDTEKFSPQLLWNCSVKWCRNTRPCCFLSSAFDHVFYIFFLFPPPLLLFLFLSISSFHNHLSFFFGCQYLMWLSSRFPFECVSVGLAVSLPWPCV